MLCPIRYVCGGGCRTSSIVYDGSNKPDPISCEIKRWVFEECLWIISMVDVDVLTKMFPSRRGKSRETVIGTK